MPVGDLKKRKKSLTGANHQARIAAGEGRVVGGHRAVEGEEVRVFAIGIGVDLVALGIALAAIGVGLLLRLADEHHHVAVGLGLDRLLLLLALGTVLGRLAGALRVHPGEDLLGDLPRQVGTADADVDRLDAEALRLGVHLVADLGHQLGAVVAHDLRQVGLAEHAADRRVHDVAELAVGLPRGLDRLVELERIDDSVAQEGVDLDPRVVGGQHLLVRRLQVEDALVEVDDVLDQRDLEVQPRLGDEAAAGDRLAEAQQQRLLRLRHDERAGEDDDEQGHDRGGEDERAVLAHHGCAPVLEACGFAISGSGR